MWNINNVRQIREVIMTVESKYFYMSDFGTMNNKDIFREELDNINSLQDAFEFIKRVDFDTNKFFHSLTDELGQEYSNKYSEELNTLETENGRLRELYIRQKFEIRILTEELQKLKSNNE